MRVAFVIQTLKVGGAQRAVVSLANSLVERGMSVAIYVFSAESICAYELDSRVIVQPTGLSGGSKGFLLAIKNNLLRIMHLRRVLLRGSTDIVVGMSYTANVLVSLATIRTSIVAVGSERSHPEFKETGFFWRQLRAHCYKWLQVLVCLTNDTAKWVFENTNLRNVVVIPNGVEVPLASSLPIVEVPSRLSSKNIVLSVGRLVATKQFDHLISVFAELSSDHPDWVLVIAGDGPEREALKVQIGEYGLSQQIVLLGTVGNLHDWYTTAEAFVFVSRLEGFPNSLLEAMAYGLACISYDCKTGPADLIESNVSGELVPVNDKSAVREVLANIIEDSAYRASLSIGARKAAENFSMDMVSDRWCLLLESLVSDAVLDES